MEGGRVGVGVGWGYFGGYLHITGKYNNNVCSCSSGHTFVGGPTKVHLLILANPCCGPSDHGPKLAGERKKKKRKKGRKKKKKKRDYNHTNMKHTHTHTHTQESSIIMLSRSKHMNSSKEYLFGQNTTSNYVVRSSLSLFLCYQPPNAIIDVYYCYYNSVILLFYILFLT